MTLSRKKIDEVDFLNLKSKRFVIGGVKVYPDGQPEIFCTDHWRCRFVLTETSNPGIAQNEIIHLLQKLASAGLDFIKTENLYNFNGNRGYSLGQGE